MRQTLKHRNGGQLNNWGPHLIDHAIILMDSPIKEIWSDLKHTVTLGDAEDHIKVVFRGENNRIIDLEISDCVRIASPVYTVYGSRGSLVSYDEKEFEIVTNHFNMFDYVLTSFVVFPRKLNVVASEEPFKSKITVFGMKFFGAIEANRETKNMSFINKCADVLKKGQLVQIYPEGRNTPDGKIHEFKPSYTLIAHRANVPIVLVITDGNYGIFKRTSVIVSEEIDVSKFMDVTSKTTKKEDRNRLNEYIHSRALELREELEVLKKKGKK